VAGGQERILRRRVRTVESTKKITRAMELIAAAEMSRAQSRIAGSKPYLNGMERVLADVTADGSAPARLMGEPESPEHVAVVAVVSDRGLAGGYNAFVLRQAEREMKTGESAGRDYTITAAGKKAIPYLRFRGRQVDHYIPMPDRPTYEDARKLAVGVVGPFLAGELDLVQLVSTRFVSAGIQTVETRQLLPLMPPENPERRDEGAPRVAPAGAADGGPPSSAGASGSGDGSEGARGGFFEYEPPAQDLLALLVPRYAEAALYGALLEASASEHIARQRAMSAATENADELIKNLRRVMNRARQDSITTEIMEIVGGAEAFRHGAKAETAEPFEYHEEQIA
jgi:F-type H+-transporting ATPase subunit gamma